MAKALLEKANHSDKVIDEYRKAAVNLEESIVVEVDPIADKINSAEETNKHVRANAAYRSLETECETLEGKEEELSETMDAIDEEKETAIRDA